MSLFKKIIGGGDKPAAGDGSHQREFERVAVSGSTLTVKSTGQSYPVNDISLGGFSIDGYEGKLRGNQYFEFKFTGTKRDGTAVETEGMAIVVRVKNEQLAAKFPPQPRLRTFLRDFFD